MIGRARSTSKWPAVVALALLTLLFAVAQGLKGESKSGPAPNVLPPPPPPAGLLFSVNSTGDVIGGSAPGAGNVISANRGNGIAIFGNPVGNTVVQRNRIGTQVDGKAPLGNALNGIAVENTGAISNLDQRALERWLTSEELHRANAPDGTSVICLNSLMACLQNINP